MSATTIRYRGRVINHDPMTNPENGYVEGFYYQDLDNGVVKHYIFNCPMTWEVDPATVRIIRHDDNKLSGTVDNSAEAKSCTVSLKAIEDSIDSVQFVQSGKIVAVRFNTQNYENEVELQLDDYEIKIRDGKTYAVRKKPAYPDNYEECVRIAKNIHGYDIHIDTPAYSELMESFVKLFICRDAYWKIAGEQMGLDGPWEPDWKNTKNVKYGMTLHDDIITKMYLRNENVILAFPTEEMRDAFYENFKDLIESCKELL